MYRKGTVVTFILCIKYTVETRLFELITTVDCHCDKLIKAGIKF